MEPHFTVQLAGYGKGATPDSAYALAQHFHPLKEYGKVTLLPKHSYMGGSFPDPLGNPLDPILPKANYAKPLFDRKGIMDLLDYNHGPRVDVGRQGLR